MNDRGFLVKGDRFSLTDPTRYILTGWIAPETKVMASLSGRAVPVRLLKLTENIDERHSGSEARIELTIPRNLKKDDRLLVYTEGEKGRKTCFSISGKDLEEKGRSLQIFMEMVSIRKADDLIRIQGWAVSLDGVSVEVLDQDGKKIETGVEWYRRIDVVEWYTEAEVAEKCGFNIELRPIPASFVTLVFTAGDTVMKKRFRTTSLGAAADRAGLKVEKGRNYFRYNGTKAFMQKAMKKIMHPDEKPIIYSEWIRKHLPTERVLALQRAEKFPVSPLISIVVPLYKTPEEFLRALVASVQAQTYANWEMVLSDGSGAHSPLTSLLKELASAESRITVLANEKQLDIAANTNAGIMAAKGEYIAFADHDDVLSPNALYEIVREISRCPEAEVFYSDEDKIGVGEKYMQPNLKPDFDPDFLTSVNYICHLLTVKKELIGRVGMMDPEFNGAQDYDFILRCTEKARSIRHIPKVLYHWRFHEGSTAENPESKTWAFEAGKRAVEAHYRRLDLPADVTMGEYPGLYRTHWHWGREPLVTVLIPNKDHIRDLKLCLDSIREKGTYQNLEFVIVENNSTEKETFAYYEEEAKKDPRIRVVRYEGEFNYSKINNFGEKYARGEYLLLLNNDIEIITPDFLEEMLGYGMRKDVAAVGARLYYEDNMIQHAGVIVGWGGVAGHAFVNQKRGTTGYQHRIICAQDYSAVTAACMLVRRSAFEEVGGFTEELAIAFNDIDFCMKLREAGYLIVYNPYAELYHYESKSRGLEDTPQKVARFQKEMDIFQKRWPEILRDGDPYYNPNLSMVTQDFSLKRN